jgi:hypothetical protein
MKSPLSDRSRQTSCKECVFAEYEGKTQVGCSANRIIKFKNLNTEQSVNVIEAYDNDKEFYVINGFCNYYRSKKWNDGIADLDKAKKESSLTFDLFVDCNSIDINYVNKIDTLLSTIDYDTNKLNVVLYHLNQFANQSKELVLSLYNNHKKLLKISVCTNNNLFLHESVLKSNSSFYIAINKNQCIDSKTLTNINNLINDDIKKFIVVDDGGTKIISNIAYKMQFLNTENSDYEKNVCQIIEKAKELKLYFETANEK